MAKNATVSEDENKQLLRGLLHRHFLFKEEVTGRSPVDARVRIDFWCFPKEPLIQLGWPNKPFGIEAKSEGLEAHRKRTAIRLVYQAAVYQESTFPTKNGEVNPYFVLIYPPLATILGLPDHGPENLNDYSLLEERGLTYGVQYCLERMAALFRVGEFFIKGSQFEVRFNGARFFSSERGLAAANPLGKVTTHASR